MLEILGRIRNLDIQAGAQEDEADEPLGFLGELRPEEIEAMSAEELYSRIGPEEVKRFEENISKEEQLRNILKQWKPWWTPLLKSEEDLVLFQGKDPVPQRLFDLPPLSSLTKERSPEGLWNNLLDLLYFYIYFTRRHFGDIAAQASHWATELEQFSQVLGPTKFAHESGLHALRSSETKLLLESDEFLSDPKRTQLLEDVISVLRGGSEWMLSMLSDFYSALNELEDPKSSFMAKKLYFYNVWLADQAANDYQMVEAMLHSMALVVSDYLQQRKQDASKTNSVDNDIK